MFFRPYSKEELKEILTERAWKAFKPDAVDHEVIDECVKYTAEEHRDVRGMVDLLRVCEVSLRVKEATELRRSTSPKPLRYLRWAIAKAYSMDWLVRR